MKEYMVQMKKAKAKWIPARSPNTSGRNVFTNYEEAVNRMDSLYILWDMYKTEHKHLTPEAIPRQFRIVKRDVTEWEEV